MTETLSGRKLDDETIRDIRYRTSWQEYHRLRNLGLLEEEDPDERWRSWRRENLAWKERNQVFLDRIKAGERGGHLLYTYGHCEIERLDWCMAQMRWEAHWRGLPVESLSAALEAGR